MNNSQETGQPASQTQAGQDSISSPEYLRAKIIPNQIRIRHQTFDNDETHMEGTLKPQIKTPFPMLSE